MTYRNIKGSYQTNLFPSSYNPGLFSGRVRNAYVYTVLFITTITLALNNDDGSN